MQKQGKAFTRVPRSKSGYFKKQWHSICKNISLNSCIFRSFKSTISIYCCLVNTTLDQWEVLETVVQLGSFAAAAAHMNRSQSTISYAISRLQDQFKVPLLELKGRKAQLTEAGKALLADVEPLLTGFRALEQRAASLAAGGETQISVSVDSVYPDGRLFNALAELTHVFPHVHPKLHRGTFLSSVHEFTNFGADLCIAGTPTREHLIKPILDIRIKAVARADHPLSTRKRQLTRMDLAQRLAVIIEGATGPDPRRQPHAPSQRHLAVTSIDSAIEAVRSGMCFGWLPVYRIRPYLESGELVGLRLPMGGERFARMFLVLREFDSTSREKNYLADLFGANRELEIL
ncbi:MAG TPA: LysR family transcriptional regulator [Terracidiphilus sp.]|nr:LysR family transcriptional regulator [Terracidiphilus sp.]